jgi:hypothetical protein
MLELGLGMRVFGDPGTATTNNPAPHPQPSEQTATGDGTPARAHTRLPLDGRQPKPPAAVDSPPAPLTDDVNEPRALQLSDFPSSRWHTTTHPLRLLRAKVQLPVGRRARTTRVGLILPLSRCPRTLGVAPALPRRTRKSQHFSPERPEPPLDAAAFAMLSP